MRRVIRSLDSQQYFRQGQWTADSTLAEHFPDTGKVIDACLRYHLSNVELVLQADDLTATPYDTHLRLFDYVVRE
jgi:hypothetical protein